MATLRNTVLQELQQGRSVADIAHRNGLTSRQVHGVIKNLDLTYHIDRIPVGNCLVYKINRRRVRPMRAGVKRH